MSIRAAMPTPVKIAGRAMSVRVGSATAGRRQLPAFIMVGAQRAGTTSLFRALMSHPLVYSASYHKGVGDTLTLHLATPQQMNAGYNGSTGPPRGPSIQVRIVGVGRSPWISGSQDGPGSAHLRGAH